jgi:hypothetical protein
VKSKSEPSNPADFDRLLHAVATQLEPFSHHQKRHASIVS